MYLLSYRSIDWHRLWPRQGLTPLFLSLYKIYILVCTCIADNEVPLLCRWISLFQQDALINLIRRAQPIFLQCLSAKVDGGGFDVPALRTQLHSTHLLPALQLYRIGLTHSLTFRCYSNHYYTGMTFMDNAALKYSAHKQGCLWLVSVSLSQATPITCLWVTSAAASRHFLLL